MARSAILALVLLLGLALASVQAQTFSMPVVNNMQDSAELWRAGTLHGCSLGWSNDLINKKRTQWVAFKGYDPFYLVVRVPGVDFHAGLKNLRELIGHDPNAILELGGVFAYQANTMLVWNPYMGRWEQHVVAVPRRVAVRIDVIANGNRRRIQANPR